MYAEEEADGRTALQQQGEQNNAEVDWVAKIVAPHAVCHALLIAIAIAIASQSTATMIRKDAHTQHIQHTAHLEDELHSEGEQAQVFQNDESIGRSCMQVGCFSSGRNHSG